MTTDAQDLRDYATHGDEAAFRRIVERHAAMVNGAALRVTQNAALAQEITQAVFCTLARKGRFISHAGIAGWLHTAAVSESRNALRKETRRQRLLHQYQETMDASHTHSPAAWSEVRPLLDRAMQRLSDDDRQLMMLRFFEQRSFREIAAATGRSEEACRQKARRALERLGEVLTKRGAVTTGAALGIMLSAQVLCPPVASAAAIAMAASQSAAGSSWTGVLPKLLFYMKTQNVIKITAAVALLAAIPAAIVLRSGPLPRLPESAASVPQGQPDEGSARASSSGKQGAAGPVDWQKVARDFEESDGLSRMLAGRKLQANFGKLSAAELEAGLASVSDADIPDGTRMALRQLLVEALAPLDPMAVLNRFPKESSGNMAVSLTPGLRELAKTDLAAADAWLKEQVAAGAFETRSPSGKSRYLEYYQGALLGVVRESDPAAFGKRFLEIPADQRGDALRWATNDSFSKAADAVIRSGDPAVLTALLDSGFTESTVTMNNTKGKKSDEIYQLLDRITDSGERERLKAKLDAAAAKTYKMERY